MISPLLCDAEKCIPHAEEGKKREWGLLSFLFFKVHTHPFFRHRRLAKRERAIFNEKGEDFTNFFKSCKKSFELFFSCRVSPLLISLYLCIPPLSPVMAKRRGERGGWDGDKKGKSFYSFLFCLAPSRILMQRENPCRHILPLDPWPFRRAPDAARYATTAF